MAISSSDVSLVPRKFLVEQSKDFEALKSRLKEIKEETVSKLTELH